MQEQHLDQRLRNRDDRSNTLIKGCVIVMTCHHLLLTPSFFFPLDKQFSFDFINKTRQRQKEPHEPLDRDSLRRWRPSTLRRNGHHTPNVNSFPHGRKIAWYNAFNRQQPLSWWRLHQMSPEKMSYFSHLMPPTKYHHLMHQQLRDHPLFKITKN
jgi:hypothetical protein